MTQGGRVQGARLREPLSVDLDSRVQNRVQGPVMPRSVMAVLPLEILVERDRIETTDGVPQEIRRGLEELHA